MDKNIYIDSLNKLVENLNSAIVSLDTDIVIALSRKGPRLLEYLRKNMGLKDFPVMTEHALPFLFDAISKQTNKSYRIYIVDDAIYFGSTILALKEEIESYINIYGLSPDNVKIAGIFTCIKDSESLDFKGIQLKTIDGRPGYGHFFVKEMMKNLRSLGKSLEVEFPEICYDTDKIIDIQILYLALRDNFGEDRVYLVDDVLGIKSISILLSDVKEATFRKLRIFVDENHIRIVSISPELAPANLKIYSFLSFGNMKEINLLWREIAERLDHVANLVVEHKGDKRNVTKTAVVLLNYFSSIDAFCSFRKNIEDAILRAAGFLKDRHVDASNLFYLLGNELWARKIADTLTLALANDKYYTIPSSSRQEIKVDNIIFESSMLSNVEVESLKMSNLTQVFNSYSMESALSSMFFNQTLMIERWSRYIAANRHERLRFGYTFQYLWNFIWTNANNLATDKISPRVMHRWVDIQIDNGSIVPQYILDGDSFKWVRVFRPGENEDFLISHLGRFAVHVFNQMLQTDEDKNERKVLLKNLNGVLSVVFHHFQNQLEQEELVSCLSVDFKSHKLNLKLDDRKVDLVQFLQIKNIFKVENNRIVRLSARVDENEFSRYTTLSQELQQDMDAYIQKILDTMGNKPQARYIYFNTINYFLSDMFDIEGLEKALIKVGDVLEEALRQIYEENIDNKKIDDLLKGVIETYQSELGCYEINFSVLLNAESKLSDELRPYLWNVCQMTNVVNILLLLFYRDIDRLLKYVENELSEDVKRHLQASDIFDYLLSRKDSNANFLHDMTLKSKLKDYIHHIILTF